MTAKRAETSAIAIVFLVMNLKALLLILLRLFAQAWGSAISIVESIHGELRTDLAWAA